MHHHFDMAQFGEDERTSVLFGTWFKRETVAVLLEDHAVIAKTRLKPRIPRFLPGCTSAKKSIKSEIYSFDGILEDLGNHLGQIRAHLSAFRQLGTLAGVGHGLPRHLLPI